jgi:predicted nucleic acid-binding protein
VIEFFDSSALVKRYLPEDGSASVRRTTGRAAIAVARITFAEIAAAVARAERRGIVDASERDRVLDRLATDAGHWTIAELRPRIVERVRALVCRHPLRPYDAVQLASALDLRASGSAVRVWCTDETLCAAILAEGLKLVRPS